ncbi:MAG: dihydropteroate synthase [Candidatus Thermoplasmatota archaeon]
MEGVVRKLIKKKKNPLIMGILNVTPDSFSDGGNFLEKDKAVERGIHMYDEGADIIDIGGESTRPGSMRVNEEEEIKRVLPVIEKLRNRVDIPLSVDTYKSNVAEKAIGKGVEIVNDVTALRRDPRMAEVVRDNRVDVCLMHIQGEPENMQKNPEYKDVIQEIKTFLKKRIDYAEENSISKDRIIIDPGIGFGKRTGQGIEDNCEIIKSLGEFKKLKTPLLIGASRKTFIGNVCGRNKTLAVNDRLEGSLTAAILSVLKGADVVRVHDVKETRRCLDLLRCVEKSKPC